MFALDDIQTTDLAEGAAAPASQGDAIGRSEEAGADVLDALFGWLFDVIAAFFGGEDDQEEVADLPEAPRYVPEDPVPMTDDIVFIEVLPETVFAEETADVEPEEDNGESFLF